MLHENHEATTNLASCPCTLIFGGADRDRTDDILLAKQVLSQTELQPLGDHQ